MEEGVEIPLGYRHIPCHSLFACEPPRHVYHYTDLNGASGILESKSLRLTKLSYLNDETELKLAIDLFQKAALNKAEQFIDSDKKEFFKKSSNQVNSFRNTNICVASFCENGDLLSQWRSYGKNGTGAAVRFDARKLSRVSNSGLMNLWKCVYSKQEHQQVINGLLHILEKSYDIVAENKGPNWDKTKSDLLGYFNTTFLRVAPVIKNSHFHEENEWRIITVTRPFTDENWYSVVSNERVSQYYLMKFGIISGGKNEFVDGIVVGPTRNSEAVRDSFRVLLHKNGYENVAMSWSQIPFRG